MQQLKMNIQACEGMRASLQHLGGSILYYCTVFVFLCVRIDATEIKYIRRRVAEYYQSSQLQKDKSASCLHFTQSPLITRLSLTLLPYVVVLNRCFLSFLSLLSSLFSLFRYHLTMQPQLFLWNAVFSATHYPLFLNSGMLGLRIHVPPGPNFLRF